MGAKVRRRGVHLPIEENLGTSAVLYGAGCAGAGFCSGLACPYHDRTTGSDLHPGAHGIRPVIPPVNILAHGHQHTSRQLDFLGVINPLDLIEVCHDIT